MTEQVRRAARLVQTERLLRRRPGGWTVVDLARELACSPRTIQRDIAVLESDLGVPLVLSGRRYLIMPGAAPLAPVRFTLQEARAIYLATRLFLRYADERDPDGISALEKLAAALPEPVSAQVDATANQLRRKPHHRAQTEVLRNITEAWAASRTTRITYRSSTNRDSHIVTLDPYFLEPSTSGAATYVIGFSHEHAAIRTFKVDRIQKVEATGVPFEARGISEIVEQMANSWGVVFGDDTFDITIDFATAVADRIRETNWHPSQRLSSLDNGGVRLELTLPSLLEFVPWVLSWGAGATVVAPSVLRDQVAAALRSAAAQYD